MSRIIFSKLEKFLGTAITFLVALGVLAAVGITLYRGIV
jgi:hypothetical protein